jgi:hypothetical protein
MAILGQGHCRAQDQYVERNPCSPNGAQSRRRSKATLGETRIFGEAFSITYTGSASTMCVGTPVGITLGFDSLV